MSRVLLPVILAFLGSCPLLAGPTNPILYVTQIPIPDEINSRTASQVRMSSISPMQNPLGDTLESGRGGALMLRMPDGSIRNLTLEAGFGTANATGNVSNFQGANSIAVQRPFVNWDGTRAVFSMVVGAPANASDTTTFYWQLYEVTNLAQVVTGAPATIVKVPGQPANYNNLHACYGTDGRIIFSSDRPRGGLTQLYPQRDEYLLHPINTGLWSIDPTAPGGDLKHLIHAPSGCYRPFVDSSGRLIFLQWDHLSRDPEAVTDKPPIAANGDTWPQTNNGTGNFASEAANAAFTTGTNDNYPEPRNFDHTSLLGTNLNGNSFNLFFPWQANEDGSGHEIIIHAGRHDFLTNFLPSFTDDTNLVTFNATSRLHPNFVDQLLHISESPVSHGTFYSVDGPDFGTHGAGQIVTFNAPAGGNADSLGITYVTPEHGIVPNSPPVTLANIYRTPELLSNGALVASHTQANQADHNTGTPTSPASLYNFRLVSLSIQGGTMLPDAPALTNNGSVDGSTAVNLSYFANGQLVTYSGSVKLWELDPTEIVARTKPSTVTSSVAGLEQQVFNEEGVDIPTFKNYLRTRNQALVVNRNSTMRDRADRQQPFNLKVAWSATQTIGAAGKIYDIGWLQVMQADGLRGLTMGGANPIPGRRILPVPLHDTISENPPAAGAPSGAVKLGDDGSFAVVLPANRAVTWNLLDGPGTKSQVKERYWVSFAPGEIRTCAVCHGINTKNQANVDGLPQNKSQALRSLLQFWKGNNPPGSMQHSSSTIVSRKDSGSATLSVTRTGGSVGPVSVNYATANGTAVAGTDYAATSGTLTWLDGDTTAKTITIPLLNNPTIAASKNFTVALSGAINGSIGATATATLTLQEPPFQAWLFLNFGANANVPAIAGDAADPDGDGLANLLEYALNGNPTAASSTPLPMVATEIVGGTKFLTITYTHDVTRTDVSYHSQVSNDLSAGVWNDVSDAPIGQTGNLETRKASVPFTGAKEFLHVKVSRP
jgi:hypothetical protein